MVSIAATDGDCRVMVMHWEVCDMQTWEIEAVNFKLHKLLNGSIIVLALLTVLEDEALTEWKAMAVIFMTVGANAVADAFARGLADEIAYKRQITIAEASALLGSSLLVVVPAVAPALAFAAVAAGWLSIGTAFASACWFLVFALFAAGFAACKASGGRAWRGMVYGGVISVFGLSVVALRLMAH